MKGLILAVSLTYVLLPRPGHGSGTPPTKDQKALNKALCRAAARGQVAKVKDLLSQGAEVNANCGKGYTPLSAHLSTGYRSGIRDPINALTVQVLLEKGADPNTPDALSSAIASCYYDRTCRDEGPEAVRLLLAYGADLNRPSGYVRWATLLDYARDQGSPRIIELVEQAAKVPPGIRRARALRRLAQENAVRSLAEKLPAIEAAERSGDESLRFGNSMEALDHYLAALRETPASTDKGYQLREKAIKAALAMKPAPAVPEKAKLHAERAQAFLKRAEGIEGYERVISELEQTSLLAPWWASVYYNLGSVQEKVEDFEGAARSLKLYLLASPQAADAETVRKKIVDLEVAQELEGSSPSAATQNQSREEASDPPKRTP